jgi:hypothetical protein
MEVNKNLKIEIFTPECYFHSLSFLFEPHVLHIVACLILNLNNVKLFVKITMQLLYFSYIPMKCFPDKEFLDTEFSDRRSSVYGVLPKLP